MTEFDLQCQADHSAEAGDKVDFARIAELDGVEAFVSGELEGQNPFTVGHDLHAAWLRGFREAQMRLLPVWRHVGDATSRHGR